ncbi:GTP1/OBG sub domain protein [Candidatus Saccharibacteria bacterium RIFCSPHIGHO2_02_FULL_47_12]|nr:MAG: GTP1/OBG sub domain protein [Candidatus Saccharibacteria bacterium RIFCSPHIGHO2_02_FULL_47_12]
MFVDKVKVTMKAGDGGNGIVSFRHEKFISMGGPDGGDGGNGGNVVVQASRNQDTLAAFRYKKEIKAEPGRSGSKRKKHGKSGDDLLVELPVGTVIANDRGEVLADLTTDGQQVIIAKGGKGGFGNAHFVSSTRQAPRVAEKGEKGEALEAVLELKLIADVGLVGLPNAGKSTLLASISNARPAIANYPFTTLSPNLGVVDIGKENSLLFADIPGLIEGASEGKGLGDEFLRHIERTSVLVHLIDIYEDVVQAYQTIWQELKAYEVDLTKRPQVVVLNKIDGFDKKELEAKKKKLAKALPARTKVFAISAQSKEGVDVMLYEVQRVVQATRKRAQAKAPKEELPVIRLTESDESWKVTKEKDGYIITGRKIERFAARTDFTNPDGVQRLRDIMRKMGIESELIRKGAEPGQKILFGDKGSIEL